MARRPPTRKKLRAGRKMGIVVASEEEDLGREKMGDGSCRFGGAVVSSLAAEEREYENGKLGTAGAARALLV